MAGHRISLVAAFLLAAGSLTLPASPANAAFPGSNGLIVFTRDGDLWAGSLDVAPHQLTSGPAVDDEPQFSADGRDIIFVRDGVLHTMNAAGRNMHSLHVEGRSPDWSPDGTRIVFAFDGIRAMNIDGSGAVLLVRSEITPDSFDIPSNPTWSPDGRVVAYSRQQQGPDNSLQSIHGVAVVPGADPNRIGDCDGRSFKADWSPDGSRVLIDDNKGLCVPGEPSTRLSGSEGAWSPDGRYFVATSSTQELEVRTLDGSVVGSLGTGFEADWQPVCTIMGTQGADVLVGSNGSDVICGMGGDDVIDGKGGADTIYGGPGNDVVTSSRGNDVVFGGTGNDVLLTGNGSDVLDGGPGSDRCDGGEGPDLAGLCETVTRVP